MQNQSSINLKQNKGCTIWFTGLSGTGKTTIATALEKYLISLGVCTFSLDGDVMREGLNNDLGFSIADREENIRRIAEVSKLFVKSGCICLCSFVSPFKKHRNDAKKIHDELKFFEVFVDTPLAVCEARDVKGLYKKARQGLIKDFTGIDQKYEIPETPDLVLKTNELTVDQSVKKLIEILIQNEILSEIDINSVKELFVTSPNKIKEILRLAPQMPKIHLNKIDLQWLQVLSEGWATPLNGFMRENEFLQALHFNTLKFDDQTTVSQSIVIVLTINDIIKAEIGDSKTVALYYNNDLYAILRNPEIYHHRKEERCARQFGTTNKNHPYINIIYESGDWLIGGDLEVIKRVKWNDGLDKYRLTPLELRNRISHMKSDAVFAFQLRNPIHNGHALLMNETKRQLNERGLKNPVLLLNPLGGWTKDDDVPLPIRILQHEAVLEENVLDRHSTILSIFPSPMMYAGPTEVQWHAKARLIAGANFYIVGRDPAGIPHPGGQQYAVTSDGNLYDSSHGARILKLSGLNQIEILPFKVAAYNTKIERMAFFQPELKDEFIFISGTQMRKYARSGEEPPLGFMAPDAWRIISNYYKSIM